MLRPTGASLATALPVAACGGAAVPSPTASPTRKPVIVAKAAARASVVADNALFRKIIVDGQGKSVYAWFKDSDDNSHDVCAAACPPLFVEPKNIAGAGVTNGKLSTSARKDGKLQATCSNQPLYSFLRDTAAAQTNGQASTGFGALWVVVRSP